MTAHPSRKLAVILHADVVGSTALVQRDESLAHERIQDSFHRFSRTIVAYGGATREVRGDALVAEFSRASDAVIAAIGFQTENDAFNAGLEDGLQPVLDWFATETGQVAAIPPHKLASGQRAPVRVSADDIRAIARTFAVDYARFGYPPPDPAEYPEARRTRTQQAVVGLVLPLIGWLERCGKL